MAKWYTLTTKTKERREDLILILNNATWSCHHRPCIHQKCKNYCHLFYACLLSNSDSIGELILLVWDLLFCYLFFIHGKFLVCMICDMIIHTASSLNPYTLWSHPFLNFLSSCISHWIQLVLCNMKLCLITVYKWNS